MCVQFFKFRQLLVDWCAWVFSPQDLTRLLCNAERCLQPSFGRAYQRDVPSFLARLCTPDVTIQQQRATCSVCSRPPGPFTSFDPTFLQYVATSYPKLVLPLCTQRARRKSRQPWDCRCLLSPCVENLSNKLLSQNSSDV